MIGQSSSATAPDGARIGIFVRLSAGIIIALVSLGLSSCRRCGEGEVSEVKTDVTNEKQENGRPTSRTLDEDAFEGLYAELEAFRHDPRVSLQSSVQARNDCEAFRSIVREGRRFLPYVVEKVRGGDYFMNQAMAEITGVSIGEEYPNAQIERGDLSVSGLWVRWWEEKGNAWLAQSETEN